MKPHKSTNKLLLSSSSSSSSEAEGRRHQRDVDVDGEGKRDKINLGVSIKVSDKNMAKNVIFSLRASNPYFVSVEKRQTKSPIPPASFGEKSKAESEGRLDHWQSLWEREGGGH